MPSRPARGVRLSSPFDTPPSAATQGEVDTVAMQDEGNALAPMAGFFNNPLKGGVTLKNIKVEEWQNLKPLYYGTSMRR